ncbi:MAG: hypothetical protein IT378_01070 [Sandaracinaceae bacterium]|nr:hypothetical protein [Sandaracinaceae bacterium]
MTYRDDLASCQARCRELETELATLRGERDELAMLQPRRRGLALAIVGVLALLGALALVVFRRADESRGSLASVRLIELVLADEHGHSCRARIEADRHPQARFGSGPANGSGQGVDAELCPVRVACDVPDPAHQYAGIARCDRLHAVDTQDEQSDGDGTLDLDIPQQRGVLNGIRLIF